MGCVRVDRWYVGEGIWCGDEGVWGVGVAF